MSPRASHFMAVVVFLMCRGENLGLGAILGYRGGAAIAGLGHTRSLCRLAVHRSSRAAGGEEAPRACSSIYRNNKAYGNVSWSKVEK